MISVIAGGILFVCSAYVGINIRRHYRQRVRFYNDFIAFLELLSDEIYFLKTPLPSIIEGFCAEKSGEFCKMLGIYKSIIGKGEQVSEKLPKAVSLVFLKQPEKEFITGFFALLGRTDCQSQLANIKNVRGRAEILQKECKDSLGKGGNLAYKLGILLGIAIMIIVA